MVSDLVTHDCPNCHNKWMIKIGQMVRCTCGWWSSAQAEQKAPIQSVRIVPIVAS